MDRTREIETILEYEFGDCKLVEDAVTRPAYERLALMGNAALNRCLFEVLRVRYPDLELDSVVRLLDANMDKKHLARIAVKSGLHKFLRNIRPLHQKQGEFVDLVAKLDWMITPDNLGQDDATIRVSKKRRK